MGGENHSLCDLTLGFQIKALTSYIHLQLFYCISNNWSKFTEFSSCKYFAKKLQITKETVTGLEAGCGSFNESSWKF